MKFKQLLLMFVVLSPLPLIAAQDEATDSEGLLEQARQRLLEARPGLPITDIRKSPQVEGFYEVSVQGGMTLYMSRSNDFLFAGDLFFLRPEGLVNATEMARTVHRKELLDTLDEEEMLVFSPRPELVQATITVFTDIDCGYCRKLHREVPELNRLGIAVRYLAYPRAGIGSESYNKAVSAWCADNPKRALTRAKAGEQIEEKSCENPVAEQYALGREFGVSGTPAIIYENGYLQAGYLPAEEMARRLGVN